MPILIVRHLGLVDYVPTWEAMRAFTDARTADTPDELWLLEHAPVFTLGQAGKREHVLAPGDIPLVQTDRGGQVTYHGPGQLTGYCLIDLKRLNIGPRAFVEAIEDALVEVLQALGIPALANRDAHGVYVEGRKIASLGLRIRKGCAYHGFSLNVDMDLEPFSRINPCGYAGLAMTQVKDWLGAATPAPEVIGTHIVAALERRLYG
ncbi:MAG: Octanoyltransferase [Moraxellaceae bacterium]|jgi:lipoyl(octanoyl) transferase|nr:Octanoyltransferase [Moraxellaceae bacterium]